MTSRQRRHGVSSSTRQPPQRRGGWYALRRTLPPWKADETLAELLSFCARNTVDEVIVKCDTEEFSHGIPTVAWLEAYLPVLRRAKVELNRRGVVYSLNPWVTHGHADRGRNTRAAHPDVDLIVGHDGAECRDCACSLSPGWRRLTSDLWRLYASTEPACIWVEDDIRLFNHMPSRYGCFCPLHLAEFSRRVGRPVTREELVSALLAPGEPHPWRRAWLDMNGDLMVDVARMFERAVHEASPKTRLGLMSSQPNVHLVEGRKWPAFTAALAGDQPLMSRPAMFSYNGDSPSMLYDSDFQVKGTLHCLGRLKGLTVQTEVDNGMFSLYAKSITLTRLQIALSFALGADGVTLNLFDHLGTPMRATPEFGDLLRKSKPLFAGLHERCHGGKIAGVQLLHAQDAAAHVRLSPGAAYSDLATDGQVWRDVIAPLGYPTTFEDSAVVALTGQVVRALSKEAIRDLLKKGLLLDLGALTCLLEAGWGDALGMSVKRVFCRSDEALSAEEMQDPEFGGAPERYVSMAFFNAQGSFPMAELEPGPRAVVASRMVDPDRRSRYPLLTLFENDLGGRVAVYPIEMPRFPGSPFLTPQRKAQFDAVLSWLARGRVPLVVNGGVFPLAFRMDFGDRSVVGAFNLSLDDWPSASFDLQAGRRRPRRVEWMDAKGSWGAASPVSSEVGSGRVRLNVGHRIPAMSVAALTVWW